MKNGIVSLGTAAALATGTLCIPAGTAEPAAEKGLHFAPIRLEGLGMRPDFWRVRESEIAGECRSVRRGRSEIIARSPAGLPVYAVFYGDFSEPPPQTNFSAATGSSSTAAYNGKAGPEQTVLFVAGTHGAEAESVAAAVNLIHMLENGRDYRGKSDPELLGLLEHYRLIVIPCLNPDGRAISPDHLRGASYQDFRRASQGYWRDGSLVGWRGSKEYFPLPLDRVGYPGGYPNSAGFNIMHDASPGNLRTGEGRALLRLCERYCVDLLLNGHSHEWPAVMLAPSAAGYPVMVARALREAAAVNRALEAAGLREDIPELRPGRTFNINDLAAFSSGALALTLECSCVMEKYDFEQQMEPNFIALKVLLKNGLAEPFADREKLQ